MPPSTTRPVLPAALALGAAHLTVADLPRSVAFYADALGLRVIEQDDTVAHLGDGDVASVVLHSTPGARPAGRHAGLYHVALLHPSREELARAAIRLGSTRTPIQGASDHGTHEAIYLADPDGNGLELAADRPRAQWPDRNYDEFARGGPQPLDVEDLLASIAGEEPTERVGTGLRVGHLHIHVGDIDQGLAFYRDLLGFEVWANIGSAAFVSAGGYHHHLAFNVWRGPGVGPAPEGVVGLREWTVLLPTSADVDEVRARLESAGTSVVERPDGFLVLDPWGIALHVGT